MPFYQPATSLPRRFRLVLSSFMQHSDLPFKDTLSEEKIQQTCDEEGVTFAQAEDDVYTPAITLWAFLSQVLFKGEQRSCVAAVARVVVLCVALGRRPCSDNTGAYCRARAKVPVVVIRRLALAVADGCEEKLPRRWLWKNRHVHLVDGTTASMPDTVDNQAAYPQPICQQQGLGFPIVRLVVLLSLATAMVKGMAMGPYAGKETGETALLRELLDRLQPGDILLADRYYCSYFMIALLMELGIDFVVRLHQCRHTDFRRGRRLGAGDYVVSWPRPQRPEWMDQETYQRLPSAIEVRQLQIQVKQPGFRVEELLVVTTLTDAQQYTKDDVAELYHQRWLVELDIRALKITLGMDVLRCKTPEMVAKEIWTCLLAYNLIRQTMLQAALAGKRSPRQLSFTAAMQKIAASWATLSVCDEETLMLLITVHLKHLRAHEVGHRPNRVEPRAIKRRPKPHKLLTTPRAQARAKLLAGAAME
jgi:putative transposase